MMPLIWLTGRYKRRLGVQMVSRMLSSLADLIALLKKDILSLHWGWDKAKKCTGAILITAVVDVGGFYIVGFGKFFF